MKIHKLTKKNLLLMARAYSGEFKNKYGFDNNYGYSEYLSTNDRNKIYGHSKQGNKLYKRVLFLSFIFTTRHNCYVSFASYKTITFNFEKTIDLHYALSQLEYSKYVGEVTVDFQNKKLRIDNNKKDQWFLRNFDYDFGLLREFVDWKNEILKEKNKRL